MIMRIKPITDPKRLRRKILWLAQAVLMLTLGTYNFVRLYDYLCSKPAIMGIWIVLSMILTVEIVIVLLQIFDYYFHRKKPQ